MPAENEEIIDFTLPSLGSDMEEGTIIEWLVAPGDEVAKGDVLLRVDTEKAEIDVEVWHRAVVLELLVEVGATIAVGTPVAHLGVGSADRGASRTHQPAVPPPAPADTPSTPTTPTTPTTEAREAASPSSTAPSPSHTTTAATSGPTPRLVYWPGPVHRATTSPPSPAPRSGTAGSADLSRAERRQAAVAALMERSNREIPQFHLTRVIDLTAALDWLDRWNGPRPPTERILPAAVLLHAVARAASGSPVVGRYENGPIDADGVDLGVAVHVRGGGLMTPVLVGADSMALDTLMSELQAMVGRARSNRPSSTDMTPAGLTVTNLTDSGVDQVLGVIRPPERALIGFGQIADRPIVDDGEVVVRSTVAVTLTADHRVINGQAGARFLDRLAALLADPDEFRLSAASADAEQNAGETT